MPSDPAIQEIEDILADAERRKAVNDGDPEKENRADLSKYSVQARANNAPWSSNVPGIGPGLFEGLWGNGLFLNMAAQADEAPPWTIYPMMRDRYLDKLWKSETIISGTLYSMVARFSALPYKVDGPPRAKQRINDMLHNFDAKRWALDLLTCDNGAFIERLGPGRPDKPLNKNLIKGLAVMDSLQCWRSFDPEFPVIYINPYTAAYHKIHYSRVISVSSMPVNRELARGIGICAVSRAMRAVQITRDIEIYKHEKVGGRFKRAIGMIKGKGVTPGRVNDTIDDHDKKQDSMGLTRFSQIPFLLIPDGDADILVKDLAGLPDGFNTKDDTDLYVNCIALAFGIDTREIWPATQTGATKGDATVQHEKARGKGNGDIIQTAERALNWGAMPDGVSMEYDYIDDSEDLAKAQLHGVKIVNITALQVAGNLTPEQGTAMLVAEGVIDPAVLTIEGAQQSEPTSDADPNAGEDENLTIPEPANANQIQQGQPQQGQQTPVVKPPAAISPKTPKGGLKARKEFNPDQPRADDGKWTDGGGESSSSPKTKGEFRKQAAANLKQATVNHEVSTSGEWTPEQGKAREAAVKYSNEISKQQLKGMDAESISSIKQYTGGKFDKINGNLRTGKTDDFTDMHTQNLDKAIDSAKIPEDTILYRGFGKGFNADDFKPGQEFTDLGYTSTSISGLMAQGFADKGAAGKGGGGVVARIFAPKGSNGLFVSSKSKHDYEAEVILPRGQRYRILDYKPGGWGERTYLDLEIVNG